MLIFIQTSNFIIKCNRTRIEKYIFLNLKISFIFEFKNIFNKYLLNYCKIKNSIFLKNFLLYIYSYWIVLTTYKDTFLVQIIENSFRFSVAVEEILQEVCLLEFVSSIFTMCLPEYYCIVVC